MILAFTLCSNNYLAQAKVLVDSFLQYHNDISFVIGLVDKKNEKIDYSGFNNCKFLQPEEIGIDDFLNLTKKYDITELNTAVKPFYFKYFFSKVYEKVIYIDPDIMFFSNLTEIINNLNYYSVCLTPHILYPSSSIENIQWELNPLQNGLFNLGFIALSNTKESENLLKWWSERTYNFCFYNERSGIFVDQLWASLFPVFFQKVKTIKNPGLNVAYWNLHERAISKRKGSFIINEKFPLVFFHFSSFKIEQSEKLTNHPIGEAMQRRNDILELTSIYKNKIEERNYSFYKSIPYAYKRKQQQLSFIFNLKKKVINKFIFYLNKL